MHVPRQLGFSLVTDYAGFERKFIYGEAVDLSTELTCLNDHFVDRKWEQQRKLYERPPFSRNP